MGILHKFIMDDGGGCAGLERLATAHYITTYNNNTVTRQQHMPLRACRATHDALRIISRLRQPCTTTTTTTTTITTTTTTTTTTSESSYN